MYAAMRDRSTNFIDSLSSLLWLFKNIPHASLHSETQPSTHTTLNPHEEDKTGKFTVALLTCIFECLSSNEQQLGLSNLLSTSSLSPVLNFPERVVAFPKSNFFSLTSGFTKSLSLLIFFSLTLKFFHGLSTSLVELDT